MKTIRLNIDAEWTAHCLSVPGTRHIFLPAANQLHSRAPLGTLRESLSPSRFPVLSLCTTNHPPSTLLLPIITRISLPCALSAVFSSVLQDYAAARPPVVARHFSSAALGLAHAWTRCHSGGMSV